jgi:beta-N-acetylhexosaminidase
VTPLILGLAGPELGEAERGFFTELDPAGYILFRRNIVDRAQLRKLTDDLRALAGREALPILIDQEGGRVARMQPPEWPAFPPGRAFDRLYDVAPVSAIEAVRSNARAIALTLAEVGINVDCLPLLDVPVEGADNVIGDRAFATDPSAIIALGRAQIEGLMEGGVLPVMKHIPGHGRATADSHAALPRVDTSADALSATDFVTFRSLNQCPMAMTAHVVYDAIDPQRPATTSPKVIRDVIRGEIGFDGLLMSDDVSMGALSGPISVRTKAALFAGCDVVLHCNGKMEEMKEVAEEAKPLEGAALKRAEHALSHLAPPDPFDPEAAQIRLNELLSTST